MAGLNSLQRYLERIYEVDTAYDVDQFLITDPELARRMDAGPGAREISEKLLVRENRDELDIALYLDAAVIEALDENDPTLSLNDANLVEFWTALEGVSHFLYMVWNAHHGRSISLFELELQAEVDKFAVAVLLLGMQRGRLVPRAIHARLFADPVFDRTLRRSERQRYHKANYYAGLFCERLQQECLQDRRSSMVRKLRRFYRLTHRHKLEHIARA